MRSSWLKQKQQSVLFKINKIQLYLYFIVKRMLLKYTDSSGNEKRVIPQNNNNYTNNYPNNYPNSYPNNYTNNKTQKR